MTLVLTFIFVFTGFALILGILAVKPFLFAMQKFALFLNYITRS